MSLPDTPYTQRERYYSVIAGQNDTDILPVNPVSTENRYLDYIARNGGGGGGGGTKIFTGTMSEWEELSPAEKAEYTHVFTTDVINTLAGYGITDAYTKAEVDALLDTETATTLYDGTVSGANATLQLLESIANFKRLDITIYDDDSTDFVHVTEIGIPVILRGYSAISGAKGVNFFLNTKEGGAGTAYMYINISGSRETDFTQIKTYGLNNSRVTITGVE